jgi:transcription initiation factor IIE alpha subunit
VKKDKANLAYLEKLVGPQGLEMIKRLSTNGLTDQQIAQETDSNVNIVRRTLSTLYEHRLASYTIERDKETGWMLYHWHVDFEAYFYARKMARWRAEHYLLYVRQPLRPLHV